MSLKLSFPHSTSLLLEADTVCDFGEWCEKEKRYRHTTLATHVTHPVRMRSLDELVMFTCHARSLQVLNLFKRVIALRPNTPYTIYESLREGLCGPDWNLYGQSARGR